MERRALVLALALTLPLALYAAPYAYASITSSSYEVTGSSHVDNSSSVSLGVHCRSGDYATGGGVAGSEWVDNSTPAYWDGTNYFFRLPNTNAWWGSVANPDGTVNPFGVGIEVDVVCQTPITVAGIGVPQFGSLYLAIALGAITYFMMSRRFATRRTTSSLA